MKNKYAVADIKAIIARMKGWALGKDESEAVLVYLYDCVEFLMAAEKARMDGATLHAHQSNGQAAEKGEK